MTPSPTLQRLQAEHPEWCLKCGREHQSDGHYLVCADSPAIAALIALVQQHEAELAKAQETIAERTSQRDECGRLAAEEGVKVFNLRSDLATAEAELAKREAQLAEVDAAVIELARYGLDAAPFAKNLEEVALKRYEARRAAREQARSKVRGSEETK